MQLSLLVFTPHIKSFAAATVIPVKVQADPRSMLQCKSLGYVAFPRCSCKTMCDCVCQLLASPLGKLQVIPLAPVPIKCTLHKVMIEMYRGNYTFTERKKEEKKKKKREKRNPIAILQEKSVSHSIHTKCFQIVHKYQRHYERFFGDETKVQESQGNRANERKQSSSCLCFLKDNQTSRLT